MNLIPTNHPLTMSSQEIADLLEKRHDVVKLSIERLSQGGIIPQPSVVDGEKSANGIIPKLYMVDKRSSYIIVAQLSPEFTAKLVDRWQELEQKQSLLVFGQDTLTHRGALLALVASLDKIAEDKPKVEYFNALVDRNLLTNIRTTAQELQIKQNEFVKWLLDNKYVYRDAKEQLKAYAAHTPSLFETKEFISPHSGKAGTQLLVTPKGRETFRLLLEGMAA